MQGSREPTPSKELSHTLRNLVQSCSLTMSLTLTPAPARKPMKQARLSRGARPHVWQCNIRRIL